MPSGTNPLRLVGAPLIAEGVGSGGIGGTGPRNSGYDNPRFAVPRLLNKFKSSHHLRAVCATFGPGEVGLTDFFFVFFFFKNQAWLAHYIEPQAACGKKPGSG